MLNTKAYWLISKTVVLMESRSIQAAISTSPPAPKFLIYSSTGEDWPSTEIPAQFTNEFMFWPRQVEHDTFITARKKLYKIETKKEGFQAISNPRYCEKHPLYFMNRMRAPNITCVIIVKLCITQSEIFGSGRARH